MGETSCTYKYRHELNTIGAQGRKQVIRLGAPLRWVRGVSLPSVDGGGRRGDSVEPTHRDVDVYSRIGQSPIQEASGHRSTVGHILSCEPFLRLLLFESFTKN